MIRMKILLKRWVNGFIRILFGKNVMLINFLNWYEIFFMVLVFIICFWFCGFVLILYKYFFLNDDFYELIFYILFFKDVDFNLEDKLR